MSKRGRSDNGSGVASTGVVLGALGNIDPFLNDGRVDVATTFRGRRVEVQKQVRIGKRGGLYYMNADNKPVYLKRYQRQQCTAGTLDYDTGACSRGVAGPSSAATNTQQNPAVRGYGGYKTKTSGP